ncbi:hypothetical protein ABB37_06094 [Leptomonas pyrrhocoris]|uniref:Uncharacterized protein n=1 Tax=Leptomonas pyrrhocoris TaxID=157538 RepID=A0A0M9FYC3_LEPPY|nr:hypothetical protein ABB37_06094 [Leptomonas pyrrhocoris]KPA78473.1 hypothetical protein ABB37_06094 [Leptomonas pyrrhocoris]|eukprot:XP_015656912.1 hypothetical protein ABB37_06094 [Leptomonas pyrrhocoris]
MYRSLSISAPVIGASAMHRTPSRATFLLASAAGSALRTSARGLSVRTEDFFSKEAVSHARRVSWAPHTTEKKVGAFAKLARSNFNDPVPESFHNEPYFEEEIEAYRAHHRPDVYIYKYNVSPTHLSLRE